MRCKAWVVVSSVNRKGTKTPMTRVRPVGDAYARMVDDPPMPTRTVTPPKGKGAPFRTASGSVAEIQEWFRTKRQVPEVFAPVAPQPDAEICGGRIVASVVAEDEPYMGGSSAVLSITYTCDRCKHTYHGPSLPTDSDTVSAWLTAQIAALPEEAAVTIVTPHELALAAEASAAPLSSSSAIDVPAAVTPPGTALSAVGAPPRAPSHDEQALLSARPVGATASWLPPGNPVVALVAFTKHREYAQIFVFDQPADSNGTVDALKELMTVAADPDGWLSFARRPFVGTFEALCDLAGSLGVPGVVSGTLCEGATAPEIVAVARALAATSQAEGEDVRDTVREFVTSGFQVTGLGTPWARAVATAVPGYTMRHVRLSQIGAGD